MKFKQYHLYAAYRPALTGLDEEFFSLKLTDPSEDGKQYGIWWAADTDEATINRRIRDMIEAVITEFKGGTIVS